MHRLQRVFRGESVRYEHVLGPTIYESHLEPLRDVTSTIIGAVAASLNIMERKRGEDTLRQSEAKLRLITDNMVDVVSQIDKENQLRYMSPSGLRVFGYPVEGGPETSAFDLVHPDDLEQVLQHTKSAIKMRAPNVRLEYRYRHPDGNYLWTESQTRLLYDENGHYSGAILGSRELPDTSSRKKPCAKVRNVSGKSRKTCMTWAMPIWPCGNSPPPQRHATTFRRLGVRLDALPSCVAKYWSIPARASLSYSRSTFPPSSRKWHICWKCPFPRKPPSTTTSLLICRQWQRMLPNSARSS